MGYFAVLKPDDADSAPFAVERCHINLWVLPSLLPGRRLMYFDLGLNITAGDKPVTSIEVLLPFFVEEGFRSDAFRACQDLYDTLTQEDTLELIFGEPVTTTASGQERTLQLASGPKFHPRHIDAAKVTVEVEQASRSSRCTVPLAAAIPARSSAYVRFRFRVFANRPLLTAKSPFGGVILDFRIADVRESRTRSSEIAIRPRIVPIDVVNFFAMLPAEYQLLSVSPPSQYMRILETRAWGRYLTGTAYRHPSKPMLVYYWRSAKPVSCEPVSSDNPFRVFANYDRHLNKAAITFWSILALLLIGGIVRAGVVPGINTDTALSLLKSGATALGLFSVAGAIGLVTWLYKQVMSRGAGLRKWSRAVERRMLMLRAS